ncbi:MAG: alpha/beta fold hydrolase, partial [Steroidobacteraceae bacterium]
MSGHPPVDQGRGQVSGPCEPIYFGSGEHGLFGWLHRPTGDSPESTTGLVICKPFGYEAICAHKSIRGFAEASAAIGVPALRFDYLGTGDSADISPDANQLEVWSKDVLAAIAELQRRTGVKRVCLLGIRLGAVLATIAAAQCECVDSIVAISPIVSGRRFLRDIRTTRLAAGLAGDAGNSPGGDKPVNDGSMEVSGYSLSAATLAALAQLDLTTAARPARGMLIIDGSSMPVARKWSEALSGGAGRTEYLSLPGLIEMIMTAPHDAKPPQAMVEAMCHWLKGVPDGQAAPAETGDSRALDGGPISPTTVLELPGDGPARDAVITERAVSIDSRVPVFGILAEPRFGEARRRAVILVNAGSTYHIGPNRVHVSLARHWAKCGYLVLRIDLSGLGDSSRRPEALDNDVYPPDALDDIRAAIEFVRTRYGMDDITLCGFCSGAYHSLRAAVAAMP